MVQVQALSMQQRAAPFVGDATIHLSLHACAGACVRAQSLYDVWARELSVVVSSLADKCVPMLQHFDPTPTSAVHGCHASEPETHISTDEAGYFWRGRDN